MGEPAEASSPSLSTRATCLSCGVELGRFPSGVTGLCLACAARVLTQDAPATPVNGHPQKMPRQEAPRFRELTLPRTNRSRQALAELLARGPSTEASAMVRELLATDKRISSFVAFVPFVGPWLMQRSETHTAKEKFVLTWMSISVTALALFGLLSTLPTPADELANLHRRIDTEMKTLGDFAHQYRAENGAYPDKQTWKRFADRGDPRFFDPWGRPYRYESSRDDVTVGTLGRDGLDGGSAEAADFSAHYPAQPRRQAR